MVAEVETGPMTSQTIADLRRYAVEKTANISAGLQLDPVARELIRLATAVSVTSLDHDCISTSIDRALSAGASVKQVQEIIALTSGLGVHSLMVAETILLDAARSRGAIDPTLPLDNVQQALWDKYIGTDPFWTGFSRELPGFLDAMLRLSPTMFEAFFAYCAVPWKTGTVRAWIKELAAMACDACPTHCFGPGFRVHLANAIALGASHEAILETLDIAAAAPNHTGYRISP